MSGITSLGIGSGLDLSGLLDQLKDAEREKLAPIVRQRQSYESKISAFGQLEGRLAQLRDAADAMRDPALFERVTTNTEGAAVNAAAGSSAAAGSYDVNVTDLAKAYSIATQGIADKQSPLGAGTVSLTLVNGDSLEVTLQAGASSLEDLRDAINAENGGVRASIINDGGASPHRLVLASATTGTEAAIASVDFGALAAELSLDAATEVEAVNASLTVNGVVVSSQTNQIEEAIQGVTLTLSETGQASVEVSSDTDGIKEEIKKFISAYNSFNQIAKSLTSYNAETGQSGQLMGNATLRNVQSGLRSIMTGSVSAEGVSGTLSTMGIELQLNGSFKVNDEKLDQLLQQSPEQLQAFFAGGDQSDGLAGLMEERLDQMLGSKGLMDNATNGLKTSIASLEQRYQRMESSIEATIERYRVQFTQLDGLIANMNSTSNYLAQQFDMMNAQLGRK